MEVRIVGHEDEGATLRWRTLATHLIWSNDCSIFKFDVLALNQQFIVYRFESLDSLGFLRQERPDSLPRHADEAETLVAVVDKLQREDSHVFISEHKLLLLPEQNFLGLVLQGLELVVRSHV